MKVKMVSKIKTIFNDTLLERLAAICDTNSIENNQHKMDLVQRLLNRDGIETNTSGGATNRYVVAISGYAVKIAVDDQGYKDNLMEYSLAREMPDIMASYETNGYILIQKLGRLLTDEEWVLYKSTIKHKLDALGRDYLLGDVGYLERNKTNWVMSDDGDPMICDYAYCHRLTEALFTCPRCGSIMAYDENCVHVLCTDRANCHAKYTYNDIKTIQGNKVDWDMIHDALETSISLPKGKSYVEVESGNSASGGQVFVIRNYRDLHIFNKLKEEMEEMDMVNIDYSDPEVNELLRELTIAEALGDKPKMTEVEALLEDFKRPVMGHVQGIECVIDPEFDEIIQQDALANEEYAIYDRAEHGGNQQDDLDVALSIDELIAMASGTVDEPEDDGEDYDADEPDDEEDEIITLHTLDGKLLHEDVICNGDSLKELIADAVTDMPAEEEGSE